MAHKELIWEIINNLQNNNLIQVEEHNKKYVKKIGHGVLMGKINKMLNENYSPKIIPNAYGIEGLWYITNYLTPDELNNVKEKIDNGDIKLEPISKKFKSRRVAHYGYYYSYDRTGLKTAPSIPDYLDRLASVDKINNLVGEKIINDTKFDQVIINEYEPGQQIAYHTDHIKLFGPIVACITVGQAVPINFKLGNTIKTINVEEGSMYIMTCDARYKWQHSLKNNLNENRYSITYRTVNKN
ncbi:2Og-Fe(II) oxygenase [Tupanvirus deep ocean]|uniref:2Og-Fe(II) oxygenase n=2 Tax=Tupanvirus TaxID=2094720 RepID=A0AC62AA20_9VIRU|nr:2Og-Fe(II) oxygenase [Tupanvirus deep ocean]QKU34518.1 2Og-Fe(II) oxygenase [Tupanvirus deep ocean]